MTAQEQPTAAEIERLAARLATHLSVKDSSPGFHLSDEDFRLIISALCATSLNARLATPLVQAPAADEVELKPGALQRQLDAAAERASKMPAWLTRSEEISPHASNAKDLSQETPAEGIAQAPAAGVGDRDTATALYRLARFKTEYSEVEKTIDVIAQALADREAAARADERAKSRDLHDALVGMLAEWDKLTRYGSPMAKAANERVNAARAAIRARQP